MKPDFKPYYVVIFTSTQTNTTDGYSEMASQMEALAVKQKGYIGIDSAKSDVGITNSYWETLEDIKNWKQQADHLVAQQKGVSDWYMWYNVRVCKVEREYEFIK